MYLNDFGKIVQNEWDKSFIICHELIRDEFMIMPDHFHGIVRLFSRGVEASCGTFLRETGRKTEFSQKTPRLPPKSISSFMAGVKSAITKRINEIRNTPGIPVLQYRFYDHIIRNDQEIFRIRRYIKNNPINWQNEKLKSYQYHTDVRLDVCTEKIPKKNSHNPKMAIQC